MVVKFEFILSAKLILLCKIKLKLTDGRLFSKGKLYISFILTLGREKKGVGVEENEFHQVTFVDPTVPNQEVSIVSISTGESHVLALDYDRNVWAWGKNDSNQINPYVDTKDFPYPVKLQFKVRRIILYLSNTILK